MHCRSMRQRRNSLEQKKFDPNPWVELGALICVKSPALAAQVIESPLQDEATSAKSFFRMRSIGSEDPKIRAECKSLHTVSYRQ